MWHCVLPCVCDAQPDVSVWCGVCVCECVVCGTVRSCVCDVQEDVSVGCGVCM